MRIFQNMSIVFIDPYGSEPSFSLKKIKTCNLNILKVKERAGFKAKIEAKLAL
jgi:ABC-type microcin C transport system duplicated ATPase subunit YejF